MCYQNRMSFANTLLCILVSVWGLLMSSFMPFNGSLNPYNQALSFLFAFCLSWFFVNLTLKGSLPLYLFSSMCITMWWSSPITKHDYVSNVLVLSHNQIWLHITLCLFFKIVFFHAHSRTKNSFELCKKIEHIFLRLGIWSQGCIQMLAQRTATIQQRWYA